MNLYIVTITEENGNQYSIETLAKSRYYALANVIRNLTNSQRATVQSGSVATEY